MKQYKFSTHIHMTARSGGVASSRRRVLLSVPLLFVFCFLNLVSVPKIRTLESLTGNQNAEVALEQARSEILKLVSRVAELQRELDHAQQAPGDSIPQVYLDMLEEAEKRSKKDYQTSHTRGKRGIVIGPIDGKFKYTLKALENARRIRNILARDSGIQLAIITSKEHVQILNGCKKLKSSWKEPLTPKVCRLWANGTMFDDIILNKEPKQWTNNFHVTERLGSRYIMISIAGSVLAPYQQSLMLDSDSYPCPGVEKFFDMINPYSNQRWPLPSTATVDLVTSFEQYPWQDSHWKRVLGKGSGGYSDFEYFADRNCGTLLYNFESHKTHVFAHFVQLVAAHVINNVASPDLIVMGEQTLYKIALYVFKKLRPEFHEEQFPSHLSCRSYPNDEGGGIDGFRNGMYPLQVNGKPCNECHCTSCLINHNHGAHFVFINGKTGWENDEFIAGGMTSNSLPVPEWATDKRI